MRIEVARSLWSSIPLLGGAYAASSLATFMMTVVVGRSLGAASLGTFALAVATARIMYAGTDFGLSAHLTRSVARDGGLASKLLSRLVTFRGLVAIATVPVSLFVAALYGGSGMYVVFACVAAAQGLVTIQSLYESLLLAHGCQGTLAALTVISAGLSLAASFAWYGMRANLAAFAFLYLTAMIVGVATWCVFVGRRLSIWPHLRVELDGLKADLRRSWRIGASMLLAIAALRTPILVLGQFRAQAEVGAFSAADTFVVAIGIAQMTITNATFPKLSAAHRADPSAFRRLFWRSNAAIAGIGLAGGATLVLFGPLIVGALFPGRDFGKMIEVMPVLGASTPALLLVHHNIVVFAAADGETANLRLMGLWLLLIATFQLALVPPFGLHGAVWGLLFARTAGLVALSVTVKRTRIQYGKTR